MAEILLLGIGAALADSGGVLVYSSDGEPSPGIRTLAQGADVLVHEATGTFSGHSTAEGAAELARAAGVGRLILVHLSPRSNDLDAQQRAAAKIFGGPVLLGCDLDLYDF